MINSMIFTLSHLKIPVKIKERQVVLIYSFPYNQFTKKNYYIMILQKKNSYYDKFNDFFQQYV